ELSDIAAYRGLFWRRPWVASWMAVFMFSLAGIPATAGFIGKVLLLGAGVSAGPWGVAMAAALIVGTIVSFYVYFKVVWQMFAPADGVARATGNAAAPWVAVAASLAGVVVLGILPRVLLNSL